MGKTAPMIFIKAISASVIITPVLIKVLWYERVVIIHVKSTCVALCRKQNANVYVIFVLVDEIT